MDNLIKISELKRVRENDPALRFNCIVLVKSAQVKIAKTGNEFLSFEFGDKSGSFQANCFANSPAYRALREAKVGDVFVISGLTEFYQGRFSPRLEGADRISDPSNMMDSLVAISPFEPKTMMEELLHIVDSISDQKLRETVCFALSEAGTDFYKCSAAVKMHHAYVHGLLEHTLSCAKCAVALLPLYPFVDQDLAIAGVVLHDIGKIDEYTKGMVTERTRTGILHGHVVEGYRRVRYAGIKTGLSESLLERLEHIILSHQGELEWGAAVKAATPEAVFVSNIDYSDARMGAVKSAVDGASGAEFVDVPAMKAKVLTTRVTHDTPVEK